MGGCWANCLGNCEGKITREHLLSESLFDGPLITATGIPWLSGQTKSIPLNSFVSKILCEFHNNTLGLDVDKAGASAFRNITKIDKLLAAVKKSDPQRTIPIVVDGLLLERWFLKSAINLFAAYNKTAVWFNGNAPITSPEYLVQHVFGTPTLKYPQGLYSYAGKEGQKVIIDRGVEYIPVYDPSRRYAGATFRLNGLSFIIWFVSEELPWPELRQYYHHMGGDFKAHKHTYRLRYKW